MQEVIRLGLPKGSLNNPERADTLQVLKDAVYTVRGYNHGKESDRDLIIVNDLVIQPFITRPQSTAMELREGMLDIAITGEDWIREGTINGSRNGIRLVGDLEYGQTKLVVAVSETTDSTTLSDFFRSLKGRERPIRCLTEYIFLTAQRFAENEAYQAIFGNDFPLIEFRDLPIAGENRLVRIIHSDGATEGFIRKEADIIADNSQSGKSLTENRLKAIDKIMDSSVGLYAGPTCTGWKERKAQEIFRKLHGAVVAKRYVYVQFNVPMGDEEAVTQFLVNNGYCGNEPTIVPGRRYAQVSTLIKRNDYPTLEEKLQDGFGISFLMQDDIKQVIE